MRQKSINVRARVLLELSTIGILTAVFLVLFPRRNPLLDVALAGLAVCGIAASAPYTRRVIWAATPPPATEHRLERCLAVTLGITIPVACLLLAIGGVLAYRSGGWAAVGIRLLNWRMVAAFGCYLPWALMQQTLLQFYLLGRLLVVFPNRFLVVPLLITGSCFGLVHLPDLWTALVTAPAGAMWSLIFYRYRLLWPLAVSHAALGSAFYYGIFGHDLAVEWRALLP